MTCRHSRSALPTPAADAQAPPFDSASVVKVEPEPAADLTVFAASATNAPLANLDRKPSLSSMLTASTSNRSPSPYKREGSTSSANGERKPSLPPPYPFASTSASVSEIDQKQAFSPVASGSGGSTPAQSGSGSGEGDDEDEQVVKPGRGRGKGKKKKVESEPQLIGHLPLAEEDVRPFAGCLAILRARLTGSGRTAGREDLYRARGVHVL